MFKFCGQSGCWIWSFKGGEKCGAARRSRPGPLSTHFSVGFPPSGCRIHGLLFLLKVVSEYGCRSWVWEPENVTN